VQCAERFRVQAYFDAEVDAISAADIERHAEHCPECRALLAELGATRARIRRDLDYERAPPELRERITRILDAETAAASGAAAVASGEAAVANRRAGARRGVAVANPEAARAGQGPRAAWRTRTFWLGALGGIGAALAASVAFMVLSSLFAAPREALLEDVVAAHVRSLMPAHLTDVVSTDQHTVKPWFAGHADVSPVVADFAPQGYRLIGGRADYLNHQRAAVVVYQHGAHVINVFTWVAGRATFPELTTRNGYHLAFWRVGNLQYCAVTDAGWDELEGLVRLLRELSARDARE
jgi:anti-sigma factor RsiW